MRIDHWKIGNSLADRHDQERQQSKPRPVTTIRVHVRPHYLQGGDTAFLDISEMWNRALGCSHVLIDSPAKANHLNLFIWTGEPCHGRPLAFTLSIELIGGQVGMLTGLSLGLNHRETH